MQVCVCVALRVHTFSHALVNKFVLEALIDVCDVKFFAASPFRHFEDERTKNNCTYLCFWQDRMLFCFTFSLKCFLFVFFLNIVLKYCVLFYMTMSQMFLLHNQIIWHSTFEGSLSDDVLI